MKFMIFLAILFPAAALSVAFIPSTTTKRSLFRATTTLSLPSSSLRLSSSSSTAASNSRTTNLSRVPIVICPGFGNDSSDYTNPLNRGTEYGFITALTKRGFDRNLITAVPLKRWEWLRVALGVFDVPNFYSGTCKPTGLGYGWYISRLRQTIEQAYIYGGQEEKVILIGHSAGGWLARAALGDGSWDTTSALLTYNDDNANSINVAPAPTTTTTTTTTTKIRASDRIRALITLGAIHKVPAYSYSQHHEHDEGDAKKTTSGGPSSCVTRGALDYVNSMYPGPYLSNEGIAYISVGGDAIMGVQRRRQQLKQQQKQIDNEEEASEEAEAAASVAYTSYQAVCGNGNTTGDGVVPLDWTLLDGSRSIILPGVYHSINKAGTALHNDNWYGGDNVIDFWLYDALDEMGIRIP